MDREREGREVRESLQVKGLEGKGGGVQYRGGGVAITHVIHVYKHIHPEIRVISPVRFHTPNTLHTDHSHYALFTQGNMIG